MSVALILSLGFVCAPAAIYAANITQTGLFTRDDQVQLFTVTMATPGDIDVRSYGYAGGITSTGTVAPSGGFDTVLTLFTAGGAFLAQNDDGVGAATDPATGQASDARLTENLLAGSYVVALTQYDNFAAGSNLADGFVENGFPNFTADPSFATSGACPGHLFRDTSGTAGHCRNGDWTLDFLNVTGVSPQTATPEPFAGVLMGFGLCLIAMLTGVRKRFAQKTVKAAPALVLLCLPGICSTASAQSNPPPNFQNNNDILNGQRTLLRDDDLSIMGWRTFPNQGYPYTVTTPYAVNSKNGTATNVGPDGPVFYNGRDRVRRPFVGRAYKSDHDQVLTIMSTTATGEGPIYPQLGVLVTDNNTSVAAPSPLNYYVAASYTTFSAAMADFNGDGYADIVMNFGPGGENADMQVFTAANPDGSKNFWYSSLSGIDAMPGLPKSQETLLTMTAADFNGDGRAEIAGVAYKNDGHYHICIYTLDTTTLIVRKAADIIPDYSAEGAFTSIGHVWLAVGKFTASTHPQLLYAYETGAPRTIKVALFDFTNTSNPLSPVQESVYDSGTAVANADDVVQVETARFNPQAVYDQAVFLYGAVGPKNPGAMSKYIRTLSVDPATYQFHLNGSVDFSNQNCISPMTIGNFDKKDKAPDGTVSPDLGRQIALVSQGCDTQINPMSVSQILLYGVSPDGKTITNDQAFVLPSSVSAVGTLMPVAGDLQGRSYLLGTPSKLTIDSSIQPSAIVGMPPMHVDYVPPKYGADPVLLNLSAIQDSFHTTYELADTSSTQTTTSNTISWSFGTKISGSTSTSVGDPDFASAEVSDTFSAAADLKTQVETETGTLATNSFNLSATTGLGDTGFANINRFNVWIYPVIGKTVCPSSEPNCPSADRVPMLIQFSAPDLQQPVVQITEDDAWYQPPWEPENIFSYPSSLAQLQKIYGTNLPVLSNQMPIEWLTDSSTTTQSTNWSTASSGAVTSSVDQTYSFENDLSFAGNVDAGFFTENDSASFDLSASTGLSHLSKSVTDVGLSTGITINKPGSFRNPPLYQYGYQSLLLGRAKPNGTFDNVPLSGTNNTSGFLQAAFVVDPLAPGAGSWWQQAYRGAPDVAFNHPGRWKSVEESVSSGPPPDNCLLTGTGASQMDCIELQDSIPDNPWISYFHRMRGFFISSKDHPGQGPVLTRTAAGTVLTLQARVYNYSFASLPQDAIVHVRFYAMPWDNNTSMPVQGKPSVYIGESKLDTLPPFSSDPDGNAPLNWVLATTTFDTTGYDNQYLAFWVVAWIADASGNLIPELTGHGLKQAPSTDPSDLKSLADVAVEQYSNNVGFFPQPFFVAAPTPPGVISPSPGPAELNVGKLDVALDGKGVGASAFVSALLTTEEKVGSGVLASFYEGDPRSGGVAFSHNHIPYVAADTPFLTKATYHVRSCGVHQLFLAIGEGTPNEIIRRAAPIRIDCPAKPPSHSMAQNSSHPF
jgi:hypothetical protein